MFRRIRTSLVLAGGVVLAACADQPTAPSARAVMPDAPSLAVVGKPDISLPGLFEAQLWVCKEGGADTGVNFRFDWVITLANGSPSSHGTALVASGNCANVASVPTNTTGIRYRASVEEMALPVDWSFSSIAVDYNVVTTPLIVGQKVSDLFLTNDQGSIVTFTNVYTPPGGPSCTLTQGFWKNHQELWDTNGEMVVWTGQTFFNSGKTYAQIFALSAAGGNSYVKLAHQYMAAKLNVNFGSDPTINAAIAQAEALLSGHTAGSYYIKNATWNTVATTLDNYNNGLTGPGHCPE